MIRIGIVEDENEWATMIEKYLRSFEMEIGNSFQIRRYRDGYEIADGYRGDLDIILMDIEMSLMNGMEAAEQIRKRDEQVIIIFITNMAQYALKGYKVNALDYVLKPIEYVAFSEILKKAIRSIEHTDDHYITVSMRDGVKKIRTFDIDWIESRGHRLSFYVAGEKYETTVYSMKEMEERLAADGFCRCSSGSLVNLRRVVGIDTGYVEMNGGRLSISRGRRAAFTSALVSYLTR